MLLTVPWQRANSDLIDLEVNSNFANVVRYFQKDCSGNQWNGIHEWIHLQNYGDILKLQKKL